MHLYGITTCIILANSSRFCHNEHTYILPIMRQPVPPRLTKKRGPISAITYVNAILLVALVVVAGITAGLITEKKTLVRKPAPVATNPELVMVQAATGVTTIGTWNQTSTFTNTSHPLPAFVLNGKFYVHTGRREGGNTVDRVLYMGTPDATTGHISTWTQAWADHGGGPQGYTNLVVGTVPHHFRNGHIYRYDMNSNGTVAGGSDVVSDLNATFGGRAWFWDSAVYVPFQSAQYVFHMAGFDMSSYAYNTRILRANAPLSGAFTDTGKEHPVAGSSCAVKPGKSVFYLPSPTSSFGYIYTTGNGCNTLWRGKVTQDGNLEEWLESGSIPVGDGNGHGDLFLAGQTLYAIRGTKVFSTNLDAQTGVTSAWSDAPPDLPETQTAMTTWGGGENEGASWGIIGNYVYVAGDNKVFYARISSGGGDPPTPTPSTTLGASATPTTTPPVTRTPTTTTSPTRSPTPTIVCGQTTCGGCIAEPQCGWCANTGSCHEGSMFSPYNGSCSGSNWAWISCVVATTSPTPTPSTGSGQAPSPTLRPSPTPTATATPTVYQSPTPSPILAAFCDGACGTCGWRDTQGTCHLNGIPTGKTTACCYHACIGTACTAIAGFGTDSCSTGTSCTNAQVTQPIGMQTPGPSSLPLTGASPGATTSPAPTLIAQVSGAPTGSVTSPPMSVSIAQGSPTPVSPAPVAGSNGWMLLLLLPLAIIVGGLAL